ncbi:MAG: CvpA family protein [Anaerovoracaceae bacterium]|jgi:uncharacterized membrane protein required for colicin V production
MVLDIIIAAIIVLAALYGLKKGFVFTLIHTCGTIGALALAYFATSPVMSFLKSNTGIYYAIKENFASHFSDKLTTVTNSITVLPTNIQTYIANFSDDMTDNLAKSFANVTFAILVYLAVFIIIKIILWLLLRLLSRDYNGGFRGFADGFFGFLFGALKGFVIVLILLALLVPVASVLNADFTQTLLTQLDNSTYAKTLYENNVLVLLLEGFF